MKAAAARLGLLALLLAATTACAVCPPNLRLSFNDSDLPPMVNGRGSAFADDAGWLVDASRLALARLGCQGELLRLPSRRLEAELQRGAIGIGLLIGFTDERATRLGFPLNPQGQPDLALAVVVTRLLLYAMPSRVAALGWDGRRLAQGKRVGVVQGTTQDRVAQALGMSTLPYAGFESGLAMLRGGRFDALLANPEILPAAELRREPLVQELSPPVQQVLYFAAASPQLKQGHADFLARFWPALCEAVRAQPQARAAGCGR
jgi:ABC-type amino acid transport substrate-binding protein